MLFLLIFLLIVCYFFLQHTHWFKSQFYYNQFSSNMWEHERKKKVIGGSKTTNWSEKEWSNQIVLSKSQHKRDWAKELQSLLLELDEPDSDSFRKLVGAGNSFSASFCTSVKSRPISLSPIIYSSFALDNLACAFIILVFLLIIINFVNNSLGFCLFFDFATQVDVPFFPVTKFFFFFFCFFFTVAAVRMQPGRVWVKKSCPNPTRHTTRVSPGWVSGSIFLTKPKPV